MSTIQLKVDDDLKSKTFVYSLISFEIKDNIRNKYGL